MTRINSNIDPIYLTDQHLMAEYRELPMVYASLNRSRRTIEDKKIISTIPKNFTLNTGHVKFFYNKLLFLENRYNRLIKELKKRNYNLDSNRTYDLSIFPSCYLNHWEALPEDNLIIKKRIYEKILMKPNWYKYYGNKIPIDWKNRLELNIHNAG